MINNLLSTLLASDVAFTITTDNLNIGVTYTIIGFAIVFLVLIAICLLLAIFAMLVQDRKKAQEEPKPAPKPAPAPTVVVKNSAPKQEPVDDKQLVAVITAAIAASMGTSTDGLVVRRIIRVGNWNQDAIEQQQNSYY